MGFFLEILGNVLGCRSCSSYVASEKLLTKRSGRCTVIDLRIMKNAVFKTQRKMPYSRSTAVFKTHFPARVQPPLVASHNKYHEEIQGYSSLWVFVVEEFRANSWAGTRTKCERLWPQNKKLRLNGQGVVKLEVIQTWISLSLFRKGGVHQRCQPDIAFCHLGRRRGAGAR